MAILAATVKALLEADGTLAGLLPGGFFNDLDIDADDTSGGGWNWAYDQALTSGARIIPHGILRWRDVSRVGPYPVRAGSLSCEVYAYHPDDRSVLAAIDRAIVGLMDDRFINASDDYSFAHCRWVFSSAVLPSPEYKTALMRFTRLTFTVTT